MTRGENPIFAPISGQRGLRVGLQVSVECMQYLCEARTCKGRSWGRYVVRENLSMVFKF